MSHLKGVVEASARIFGNVIGNGLRSGHKILRAKLIGEKLTSYYPTLLHVDDPMYEDPNEIR